MPHPAHLVTGSIPFLDWVRAATVARDRARNVGDRQQTAAFNRELAHATLLSGAEVAIEDAGLPVRQPAPFVPTVLIEDDRRGFKNFASGLLLTSLAEPRLEEKLGIADLQLTAHVEQPCPPGFSRS